MIDISPNVKVDNELTLRSVLARLQYLVNRRQPRIVVIPGCPFCGAESPATSPLCTTCTGLLERLAARFPKPTLAAPPVIADRPGDAPRAWLPHPDD